LLPQKDRFTDIFRETTSQEEKLSYVVTNAQGKQLIQVEVKSGDPFEPKVTPIDSSVSQTAISEAETCCSVVSADFLFLLVLCLLLGCHGRDFLHRQILRSQSGLSLRHDCWGTAGFSWFSGKDWFSTVALRADVFLPHAGMDGFGSSSAHLLQSRPSQEAFATKN
jgi:hypothetical protein